VIYTCWGNGRSEGVAVGASPAKAAEPEPGRGCEAGVRTLLSFGVFVS